jgi:adenylyl-sulfate kinase
MNINTVWQEFNQDSLINSAFLKSQKGKVIWLTGLSGSGKSTLAKYLQKNLVEKGIATYILDGDNCRQGLCNNLSFTQKDRVENIRRISEVAKLLRQIGFVVICSFISPTHTMRKQAKSIIGAKHFVEVYVDCLLEECEHRDPKGLYKKARNKEIENFTGIDSPYEIPQDPDIQINTEVLTIKEASDSLKEQLKDLL